MTRARGILNPSSKSLYYQAGNATEFDQVRLKTFVLSADRDANLLPARSHFVSGVSPKKSAKTPRMALLDKTMPPATLIKRSIMSLARSHSPVLEPLESRIAPANLAYAFGLG